MGLFWGNDTPKQQQHPQEPQKTPYGNPVVDRETLRCMSLATMDTLGCGMNAKHSGDTWLEYVMPNLTCLIHNINRNAYLNNVHINEIKDMMQQLIDENKALRERVEHLEKLHTSPQNSPTNRTTTRSIAI